MGERAGREAAFAAGRKRAKRARSEPEASVDNEVRSGMRPTNRELLRGIVHTLNTVIMPDLRSPWPQMVTLMTSRLLEHMIAREEGLAPALHARIPELRALLAGVDPKLDALAEPTHAGDADASVEALITEDDALHAALESLLAGTASRDPALLARIDALLATEARAEAPLYERLVKA